MTLPKLNCEIIPCGSEPGWLQERARRVQASDGSDILEGSALKVYADKTVPQLINQRLEWQSIKLAMEPVVCELYRNKYGGKVHQWPAWTIAASREHPFIGCTPDALIEDPDRPGVGILQIKCWSEFDRKSWQDSPPLYVQIQTQIEMLVTGCKWGAIAVLFGSNALERFYISPNEKFVQAMIPLLRDFWTCVELRTAPPADGSPATRQALARLHPHDDGSVVALSGAADDQIERLRRLKSLGKRIGESIDGIENTLRAEIGDATYGVTPGGSWLSLKTTERAGYTVAPATYRTLRECKQPKGIEGPTAPVIDFRVADRVKIPEWLKVRLLRQHPRCRWCGATLTRNTMSVEHVIPLAVGGTNDEHNLDLACVECNTNRGSDATLPVLMKG